MRSIGLPELLIFGVIAAVTVLPFYKIFSKAGFSGWLSLGMFIPFVNFLILLYVAFSDWPVIRELRSYKGQ